MSNNPFETCIKKSDSVILSRLEFVRIAKVFSNKPNFKPFRLVYFKRVEGVDCNKVEVLLDGAVKKNQLNFKVQDVYVEKSELEHLVIKISV